MTLMRSAPLPTFSNTVRNILTASVKETCSAFGIEVVQHPPVVRKIPVLCGDYMAGVRVGNETFRGAVTLCMDKKMGKAFAEKSSEAKAGGADEAMHCDLVGKVCNQLTASIQRGFSQLGCKISLSAGESTKSALLPEAAENPEEWLLIPFVFKEAGGIFAFGITGEFKLAQDETEELGDARSLTFF